MSHDSEIGVLKHLLDGLNSSQQARTFTLLMASRTSSTACLLFPFVRDLFGNCTRADLARNFVCCGLRTNGANCKPRWGCKGPLSDLAFPCPLTVRGRQWSDMTIQQVCIEDSTQLHRAETPRKMKTGRNCETQIQSMLPGRPKISSCATARRGRVWSIRCNTNMSRGSHMDILPYVSS
jgi:hypothetical protein